MAAGSVFKVGEDVDIAQMLLNFTVLAVGLVLFEKALHVLEHRAHKYPKYHEMINKIYRELMILGLIGLAIKLLKELGIVNDSSAEMTAFLSADLAIFLMALALILQAICIYLQLRKKNKQIDVLELFTSEDLYLLASSHERHRKLKNPVMSFWTAKKYDSLMSMRLMRYLFLRTHELPELFPFAKYLRQAQEKQITHMIDVEPTTWFIVFLVAWLWYTMVNVIANSGLVGKLPGDDDDDRRRLGETKSSTTVGDSQGAKIIRAALATVFLVFVWLLTFAHVATALYFQRCRQRILNYAGIASRADMLRRLKEIGVEEATHLNSEVTSEALQKMQRIEEELQLARHKHQQQHGHGDHDSHHDPGFQYIKSCLKSRMKGGQHALNHHAESPKRTRLRTRVTPGAGATAGPGGAVVSSSTVVLDLPFFSRRGWHFFIMLNLILNGLFAALFLQIMMFHMPEFTSDFGLITAIMIPAPIFINIAVQTRIIEDYILVSSIWRVDVSTLSEVIEHFSEVVELQTNFITQVHECLERSNTTVAELNDLLIVHDFGRTGWIDVEEFRQILMTIGYSMSFFKFNSVMKVLFHLRQLKVDYTKVITLISLAEEHRNAPPEALIVGHEDIPMLEYKLSLCASSTVMMQRRQSNDVESVDMHHPSNNPTTPGQLPHAVRPTLHDALNRSSKLTKELMATSQWSKNVDRVRASFAQSQHSITSEDQPTSRRGNNHWGLSLALSATSEHTEDTEGSVRISRYSRM